MPTKTFANLEPEKSKRIIQAALDEFADKQFEQVNISDIIKQAKIPRGSFYQYFVDKEDLYLYLIEQIKQEKMNYLANSLFNQGDLNFIALVRKLYDDGVKFAIKYPKYVKMLDHLMKNKNGLYEKIMADNIGYAEDIYADLIEKDKQKGHIKQGIDTRTFAKIIVQLTTNIAIEELDLTNEEKSYKKMLERNDQILKIIEYGVTKG
ncbi:MAG: TetR/AcrR family transcriptional regulator [Candidatus Izemoplasmatales bacterium]